MRLISFTRFPRVMAAVLGAGLLAACSHYTVGPSGKLAFETLYVSPVQNSTFVAQAQAPVTSMIRQSLLQEGNVRLVDQPDADATLDVILTNYQRNTAATQQTNTLNAQSYSLSLTALCTLVDNRTGKVYFRNRPVTATQEAFIQNGDSFTESEYQTVAKLARDLGMKVKDIVVTTW